MTDLIDSKPGTAYYVIAGIFLTWNLIGVALYYQHMSATPDVMLDAGYTAAQIDWIQATPVWANVAYTLGVFGGLLASLLLLMRKKLAILLFMVSLVGIILQDIESFILRSPGDIWGQIAYFIPTFVLIAALVEIWFARRCDGKGWLS